MKTKNSLRAFVLLVLSMFAAQAMACASCGCTLSSDWETSAETGPRLDIRYDYLNQNQLRAGGHKISSQDASRLTSNDNALEVEKYTENQYFTATLGYVFNANWKIEAQVPYIKRSHSTLGTASDGITGGAGGGQYDSNTSSLGDMKWLASYQGFSAAHDFGIMFGVKLPTGSFTENGTSSDATNPGAVRIDRGLQPGSGTTDGILGVYYLKALNQDWDFFAQGFAQSALNVRDQYRTGDSFNLNFGARYMSLNGWIPQIQLNSRMVNSDGGATADSVSTGGTLVYLSPGAHVPISDVLSVYGFFQLPVYQYLNGVQLVPNYTASVGLRLTL